MSVVDNVILTVSFMDGQARDLLLAPVHGDQAFRQLTPNHDEKGWGGAKYPEVVLLAAAFSHLDWPTLFRFLEVIPFTRPEEVQLLIRAQDGTVFGVYELRNGRLAPVNVEAAMQVATLGTDPRISPGVRPFGVQLTRDQLEARVTELLEREPTAIADEIDRRMS